MPVVKHRKHMQTQEKTQLALFSLTEPKLVDGLITKLGKPNDKGQILSVSLVAETRKAVAERMDLVNNDENREAIDKEMLRQRDNLSVSGFGEVAKAVASGNWTGKSFRVSTNKKGTETTMAFALKTVNRNAHRVSEEQLVKALASMNKDQVAALELKAEQARGMAKGTIDLRDAGDEAN